MKILVVQNYDNTGLGQLGPILEETGATIDIRRPDQGQALPSNAREHHALVMLGGAQNALDDVQCPYFPALLDLARDFVGADRAVLGICLGAQLLARALGGTNQIGTTREFGWQEVGLTEHGKADPVLGGLPERFPIFQWHDDTFTLPPGAVPLAGSAVTENQAFRFGRAAYGMQFHFEADRALVREWMGAFAAELAERQPGWVGRLEREMELHGPAADGAGQAIGRAWSALI